MTDLRRHLRLALLLAVAFWATGAAHLAHELSEHASHEDGRASVIPFEHDHGDCPTCHVLASMTAGSAAPPPPPAMDLVPCGRPVPTPDDVHVRSASATLPPARAPPAAHA